MLLAEELLQEPVRSRQERELAEETLSGAIARAVLGSRLAQAMPPGGAKVAALEAGEEAYRRLTPEQRKQQTERAERRLAAMARKRKPPETRAEVQASARRRAERESVRGRTPVGQALHLAATPLSVGVGTLEALVGRKPLRQTIARAVERQASTYEFFPERMKQEHPIAATAAGLAGDLLIDPANAAFALALAGPRALFGLGRRTLTRAIPRIAEEAGVVAARNVPWQAERRSAQGIRALGERVARRLGTQATAAVPAEAVGGLPSRAGAPVLSMDVAMARGRLRRGRGTERLATAGMARLEREQRIRPRLPGAAEPGPAAIPDVRGADFRAIREELDRLGRLRESIVSRDPAAVAEPYERLAARLEAEADRLSQSPRITQLARRIDRERRGRFWSPRTNPRQRALQAEYDDTTRRIAEAKAAAQSSRESARFAGTRGLASRTTLAQIDERVTAATAELEVLGRKYGEQVWAEASSEPLAVVRARPVYGRIVGERAAAQTELARLQQRLRAFGRVPLERRGVTFRVPQVGEPVGEEDVRKLASALAERASLSGLALTPEDAERELLGHAASLGIEPLRLQRMAAQARTLGRLYVKRITAAGVKDPKELARMERQGGYLRRIFGRYLDPEEHADWLARNGLEEQARRMRDAQLNQIRVGSIRGSAPVGMWAERRNLPPSARAVLEPIDEIVGRMQAQTEATARILPRAESFQAWAADPRLASDTRVRPDWIRLTGGELQGRADRLRSAGMEELAEEVETQMRRGGWGALTGKYLHPALYFVLNPASTDWSREARNMGRVVRWMRAMTAPVMTEEVRRGLYPRVISKFKQIATIWNPLGQGFNVLSNMSQSHAFGGIPLPLVPAMHLIALNDVQRGTPFFQRVYRAMPSLGGGGVLQEIRGLSRAAKAPGFRTLRGIAGELWQMNEAVSKTAVVRWRMLRGESFEEAVRRANWAIYDYGDRPRWVDWSRTFNPVMPFPTFAYRTAGAFLDTLLHHPRRLNVYTRAAQALERLTPQEVREAEKELQQDWMASEMPVRLPGLDVEGRAQYLRTARFQPWGALNLGQDISRGMTSPFLFGPAFEALRGISEEGRPIVAPELGVGAQIRGRATYWGERQIPVVGTVSRLLRAIGREEAKAKVTPGAWQARGKPPTVGQILTRTSTVDWPVAARGRQFEIEDSEKRLRAWIRERQREKGVPFAEWPADDPDLATALLWIERNKAKGQRLGAAVRTLRSAQPREAR